MKKIKMINKKMSHIKISECPTGARLLIIAISLVFCLTSRIFPDIIMYVDDNGSDTAPYNTTNNAAINIQTAINYISNANGSRDLTATGSNVIIYVRDGVYAELVTIGLNAADTYTTSAACDITIINFSNHTPEITSGGNHTVRIQNNYITFQGFYLHDNTGNGDHGFYISNATNVTIRDCEIADGTGNNNNGIHLGDGAYSCLIEGNEIYSNTGTGIWLDDLVDNTIIAGNRIYRNDLHGIDIDSVNNLKIYNNLIYLNGDIGIKVSTTAAGISDNVQIYNNTIYSNDSDAIWLTAGSAGANITNAVVFNNIFTHNIGWGIRVSETSDTVSLLVCNYNLCISNGSGAFSGVGNLGTDNITGTDPSYVSIDPSNTDFLKLSSSSICIDRGTNASSYNLTNDFWDDIRPFDMMTISDYESAYDIGAYEFFYSDHSPDYFVIDHDGGALTNTWERITITAFNSSDFRIWLNLGTIIIDVTGADGTVDWTNASGNCGTFSNLEGSGLAVYSFSNCDMGVVTLYIKEDIVDTINVEVISAVTAATDDDTEGDLLIYKPFLDHFLIEHDNNAAANQWEQIIIHAIDNFGGDFILYNGTITVDTALLSFTVTWSNHPGNNGTFSDLGSGVMAYSFTGADAGVIILYIKETKSCELQHLNIEVVSSNDAITDDDTEGLLSYYSGNVYYVNDNSTTDDTWCTAIGNDANSGTNTNAPKLTIMAVINDYDLEPGDHVFVDTGTYTGDLDVTSVDSGDATGYVTFTASTQGTGAVIQDRATAIDLTDADYVRIEYFKIAGSVNCGIRIQNGGHHNFIYRNEIYGIINNGTAGIEADNSPDNIIYGNIIHDNNAFGILLDNDASDRNIICRNTIYNNANDGIYVRNAAGNDCLVSQNIIYSNASGDGDGIRLLAGAENNRIYNNSVLYHATKSGIEWESANSDIKDCISAWNDIGYNAVTEVDTITNCNSYQNNSTNDTEVNSGTFTNGPGCTINDPLFVNGLSDLHLKWNSPLQGAGSSGISIGRYSGTIIPADNSTGSNTTYTNIFSTTYSNSIETNGVIYFQYPTGFTFPGLSASNISGLDGSLIAVDLGNGLVQITRSGGSPSPAGAVVKIILTGVVNPSKPRNNYRVEIWATDECGNLTEDPEESNEFRIIGGATTVTISKTNISSSGKAIFGDYITYRIDYTNSGPDDALNVKITDVIPPGTTYVADSMSNAGNPLTDGINNGDAGSFDGTQVVFCVDGGNATNTGGTIANNASGSVYFTVQITDINIVEVTNEAIVSGDNFMNTNAIDQTTVSQRNWPEVSISKTKISSTLFGLLAGHGDYLTYRIDYENTGQIAAANVKISDIIPANTTYVSNSMSNSKGEPLTDSTNRYLFLTNILFSDNFNDNLLNEPEYSNVSAICDAINGRGRISIGGELWLRLDVTRYSNVRLTFTPDVEAENASDDAELYYSIDGGASWETMLAEIDTDTPVAPTNYSLDNADNQSNLVIRWLGTEFDDTTEYLLIDNLVVTGETFVDDDGAYDGTRVVFCVDGGVTTNTGGTIAPGASGSLYFTVKITSNTNVGAVTNEAIISGDNFTTTNTILITTITQMPPAEVEISKTNVSPAGNPVFGGYLTYRIDYTNKGSSPAFEVKITDVIPTGTIYVTNSMSNSYTPGILTDDEDSDDGFYDENDGMTFTPTNGSAPGTGGFLAPGASGSFYFTVKITNVNAVGVTNEAIISGYNVPDANVIITNIVGKPNLIISKTNISPAGKPVFGDQITYRIDYTNSGNGAALDVKITDVIPAGTTYVAGSMSNTVVPLSDPPNNNDEGSYDGTQVVFCVDGGNAPDTDGTIASGASGSLYFTVRITNINAVGITNEAIISGNNFTTATAVRQTTVTQIPGPNVSIFKTKVSPASHVTNGAYLTYRIDYENAGQAVASNVKISDIIPANTTYVSNSMSNANGLLTDSTNQEFLITNTLFSDYFENNNLTNWDVTNNCSIESGTPITPPYSVRLSNVAALRVNIDTTGYTNIIFNYNWVVDISGGADNAYVHWSSNAGTDWTLLVNWGQADNSGSDSRSLGSLADNNPNFEIRFSADGGASDYLYIDDVEVTGEKMIADEGAYDGTRIVFCVDGGEATNTGGTLASGASGSVYFTVEITSNTNIDSVTNEAIIYGDNFTSATSICPTTVTQISPTIVEITKTKVSPAENPLPGDYLKYRIYYTNTSTSNAALDVTITDVIPTGTTYVVGSMSNAGGTLTDGINDDEGYYDGTQVVFCVDGGFSPDTSGILAPGASGSLYFTVEITNINAVGVTNEAIISGYNFPDTTAITQTTVTQIPRISISKTKISPPGAPQTGDYIRYRIDFTNTGAAIAFNVKIIDTISNGTVYSQGSMSNTINGSLSDAPGDDEGCTNGNQLIFCPPNGTAPGTGGILLVGSGGSFYFYVRVTAGSGAGITNTAYVYGTDFNTNYATNITTVSQAGANVAITKTKVYPAGNPFTGDYIRYRIDFANNGGETASNVRIIDTIPNGTVYSQGSMSTNSNSGWISDTPNNGAGYTNANQLIFSASNGSPPGTGGILPVGSFGSFYFTVRVTNNPNDIITNTAYVYGTNFSTNYATNRTTVAAVSTTLSISKSVTNIINALGNNDPIPGASVEYSLFYSNTGGTSATQAIIFDKLPSYTVYLTNNTNTAVGWTVEFSTNTNSTFDQSWDSPEYTNVIFDKTKITWIRWIKTSVAASENETLFYTIMIK